MKVDVKYIIKESIKIIFYTFLGACAVIVGLSSNFNEITTFLDNSINKANYDFHSNIYINDEFISEVVEMCEGFNNKTQVECVVEKCSLLL
jgi:hypothetical protein